MIKSEQDLRDYIGLRYKYEGEIDRCLRLFIKLSGIDTHGYIDSWSYSEDSKEIYFETMYGGECNSTEEFTMPAHYLWTEDWKNTLKEETRLREEQEAKEILEKQKVMKQEHEEKERAQYERLRIKYGIKP